MLILLTDIFHTAVFSYSCFVDVVVCFVSFIFVCCVCPCFFVLFLLERGGGSLFICLFVFCLFFVCLFLSVLVVLGCWVFLGVEGGLCTCLRTCVRHEGSIRRPISP